MLLTYVSICIRVLVLRPHRSGWGIACPVELKNYTVTYKFIYRERRSLKIAHADGYVQYVTYNMLRTLCYVCYVTYILCNHRSRRYGYTYQCGMYMYILDSYVHCTFRCVFYWYRYTVKQEIRQLEQFRRILFSCRLLQLIMKPETSWELVMAMLSS